MARMSKPPVDAGKISLPAFAKPLHADRRFARSPYLPILARSKMATDNLDGGEVAVAFDGRTVTFVFGELDTLVPAYAATIHKSQGSEPPAVVIPVMTQHYAMLQRNLIYTGVTRGKKLVVLVGQKKAVAIAVKNISGRRRWSKLDEWLHGHGSSGGQPMR